MRTRLGMMKGRNLRVLLSGGTGVAQRLVQLAASLVILPVVLHRLGIAGFGLWGAVTSLAWAAGIMDLGLGAALVTLIPAVRHKGEDASAYVAASLLAGAALAGLLLAGELAFALPGLLPSAPFAVALLYLTLNIPLGIAPNLWFGVQQGHISGLWDLVQTLASLAATLVAAHAGAGVTGLVLCIYLPALLSNAGSLAHVLLSQPALRPRLSWPGLAALRRVAQGGILLWGISVATLCAYAFDNIFALNWLGPTAAAQMTVALRLIITAAGLLAVATQALWPAFAEAVAHEDHGWVVRTLWQGTGTVMLLALGGTALLLWLGAPVLRLWLHQDLHLPPSLFLAMGAWISAMAAPRVAQLLLNATAGYGAQLMLLCLATPLALALKYIFAPWLGVTGILGATALAWCAVIWPGYAWLAWRRIAAHHFPKAAPCPP